MTAVDRGLMATNRCLIARRTGWPAGALAVCEGLDMEHPGWWFAWFPENRFKGWERPAGFGAWRLAGTLADSNGLFRRATGSASRNPSGFGPDIPTLLARIADIDARIAAHETEQYVPLRTTPR